MSTDLSNDVFTEGVLNLDSTTFGILEEGVDEDWYRFDAEWFSHHHFEVDLGSWVREGYSHAFSVYDEMGQLVFEQEDGYEILPFIAPASGSYFFSIVGYESGLRSTIEHRSPEDDFIAFGEVGEFIPVGRLPRILGTIETEGDFDVMTHQFLGGSEYTIDLLGEDAHSELTLADPVLRIYRRLENGRLEFVAGDNNSGQGRSSQIRFRPEETETLYLMVDGVGGTGRYEIEVASDDELGDDPDGAPELRVIRNWDSAPKIASKIESLKDVDTFVFQAVAGSWHALRLPVSVSARIYDPEGELISEPTAYDRDSDRDFRGRFFRRSVRTIYRRGV